MSDRPMQFPEKSNYADNGPQIVMEETDFCDPVEERVMGKIAEKGANCRSILKQHLLQNPEK